MAAVRQFERAAHHRQLAARPMVERLSALPRRARWSSAAKLKHQASRAQISILWRNAICFTPARAPDLLVRSLSLKERRHVGSKMDSGGSRHGRCRDLCFKQAAGGGIEQA